MAAVCFFALFSVILVKVSGEISPKYKSLLITGCGICLMLAFLRTASPVLEAMTSLFSADLIRGPFRLMMKAVGISFLVAISSSFCRDLGESGIAEKLELCGKSAVLALSIPVLKEIIEFIGELAS